MPEDTITRGEYDERLKRVDDENNRQNKRLDRLETAIESLAELTSSVRELAVNMGTMRDELRRQGQRLEHIEQEPAEKWKSLTKTIITGVVSALVAYFLAKGGII